MQNNRQLFWGQGQFLAPQHLQQLDLHTQWLAANLWRHAFSRGWGLASLSIREEGLQAFSFEVVNCEVVARSGLVLQGGTGARSRNASIAPVKFQAEMDPGGGPLSVYLALPGLQEGQSNLLTAPETAAGRVPPRYAVSMQEVPDLFETSQLAVQVGFVEVNLPIIFDRSAGFAAAQQSAELIKIAEVVPASSGAGARLSTSYIPPCLHLDASPILANRIRGLRDLLTSKAQEYEGIKRQRQDPLRLLQMQTLNRYLPLVHQMVEIGSVHPEPLYGLLRQMVGEFSVFSERISGLGGVREDDVSVDELLPYDHEDLARCFETSLARLNDLIRGLDAGAEAGITLVRDGRHYKAFLPPSIFESEKGRYYLVFDSSVRGDQLWQRLQKTAKVSPLEDMPRLLASALFGLKLELVPIPPEDVPHRGGNKTFFQIDTKHPVWSRIREQQNIAVYCDLDPNETSIKLFFAPDR